MSLRVVLWVIGAALAVGSRVSGTVRARLGRDMTFVVASRDGVARSYVMRNRRVSSHAGAASNARCTLWFRDAPTGTRILLAANTIDQIVDGFGNGEVECDGQAAVVLWFYELVMGLNPLKFPPRDVWPDSYVAHDPARKAADRITVEPPVSALDSDRDLARAQREHIILWQVGRGAEPAGRFKRHRIAVDMRDAGAETTSEAGP